MKHSILKAILYIIIILAPAIMRGGKVTITSDAVNGKVEVGETFHITIEALNCGGNLKIEQMPPGVKKVYHLFEHGTSSSFSTGGQTQSSRMTKLILTCKGETPGSYKYGPVSVDGIKSNSISYQVVASSGSNSQNSPTTSSNSSSSRYSQFDPNSGPVFIGKGNEEMYLRATVNKTNVYEQEAIEYTVKLYSSYGDIKFLGAAAAPKFDGFVIEESSDVSKSLSVENVNGKNYLTAIIARYIIFPQKSGQLTIKGNTYTVSTDARKYYHDPYFQTMTVKYPIQLNVTPNDVNINVRALPTPVPSNFIGGVGHFSLSSSLPSKSLSTNSAASIIFNIEGTGNIKYITLPEISQYFPKSIEVYSPESNVDAKVGSSNVSGKATFDYSIMPREIGDFTIPSIELSYFDPQTGEYKTLKTQPYHINVKLGETSGKSQRVLTFNPNLMPIGKLGRNIGTPYVTSIWYWLFYVVPILIFIFALGAYRKYLRDHEDLSLLRSKQANKMALKRLAKAYQCYKNHQEEQFYDEMLSALWGYLADKLKMPTSELNRGNVAEEFKKHNVRESTFMPIINLIDECEYAKYTPVSRDANMRQLYSDAVESLAKVESEYREIQQISTESEEDEGKSSDNYINTQQTVDENDKIE